MKYFDYSVKEYLYSLTINRKRKTWVANSLKAAKEGLEYFSRYNPTAKNPKIVCRETSYIELEDQ